VFCIPLLYHNTAQLAKSDVDKGLKRILSSSEHSNTSASVPQKENSQDLSMVVIPTFKVEELESLRNFLM